MNTKLTDFIKLPNGNLRIELTSKGRTYLAELIEDDSEALNPDAVFYDLIEYQLCNGWGNIAAAEVGAITDAPIIADNIGRDDNGELAAVDHVYAYMNYQVHSPAAQLYLNGFITLQGSPVEMGAA